MEDELWVEVVVVCSLEDSVDDWLEELSEGVEIELPLVALEESEDEVGDIVLDEPVGSLEAAVEIRFELLVDELELSFDPLNVVELPLSVDCPPFSVDEVVLTFDELVVVLEDTPALLSWL